MSYSTIPTRSLAVVLLAGGAVAIPSAAALAADTEVGAVAASKAQAEYAERQATRDELVRGNKAKIEYEERMAEGSAAEPASSSSTPAADALPIGTVLGAVSLSIVVAGGTVLVVRRQQSRPRTT